MKRLKYLMVFTLFFNNVNAIAQTSVSDTLQYLQDSIVTNKGDYIGKPLDTLLSDLKLSVIQYSNAVLLERSPDTLYQPYLLLYFDDREYSVEMILKSSARIQRPNDPTPPVNFHIKRLKVTFVMPVPVPKTALEYGQYLSDWWWTPAKANYYGKFIVADLEAFEM